MFDDASELITTATELRDGRLRVGSLANVVCDRIDAIDDAIRAFVPEPHRRNRLQAAAATAVRQWPNPADRPPLFGVPVAVKDVIHVDGLPTRAGSALPPDALAGPEAALVARLRAAGALIAGKTHTAEFAGTAPAPTRNPRHLRHTPGGSSSGSAAAIAAGLVPLAVGTQTVGSIIRPAAYCGVVGFKVSYGRIAVDGVIAHSPSFDTVGLFASDVAGITVGARIICDDWRQPSPGVASAPTAVLALPAGPYLDQLGREASTAFAAQVDLLSTAGFQVKAVPLLEDLAEATVYSYIVNRYELAQTHQRWFAAYADSYRAETAKAIREGQQVRRSDYLTAKRRCATFKDVLIEQMRAADIDALVAPAALGPAPPGLVSTGDGRMNLPWSVAGLPVLSLPAGTTDLGLPLALQCVGHPNADEDLLALGSGLARSLTSVNGQANAH